MRPPYSIGFFLAAAVATQSVAQDTDTQMMMAFESPMPSAAEDTSFTQQFGTCAAAGSDFQHGAIMRSMPASGTSDHSLFWIAMSSNSCRPGGKPFNFNPRALRGPIAEYLLKRDIDLATWKPKRNTERIFAMPGLGDVEKLSADTRSGVVMLAIGECVFGADHVHSAQLFASAVNSADEAEAFGALSPALSKCIPAGVQLKTSKFQMRGILAEAAYRAAVVAPKGQN